MLIREVADSPLLEKKDKTYVGVEIEMENYNGSGPQSLSERWRIAEDGSLRNNGVEFILRSPLPVVSAVKEIDKFYSAWRRNKSWQANVRTSMHVHVNCLDYNEKQLQAILSTYCILEPLLYNFCGELREENIYCVPWYRSDKELQAIKRFLRSRSRSRLADTCKYSGLFTGNLTGFGSIEFRMAPVFESSKDAKLWIRTCARIVSFARSRTPQDIIGMYSEMGPDRFCEEVLGKWAEDFLGALNQSPEFLIDQADSVGLADEFIPCTYKGKWPDTSKNPTVKGKKRKDYHKTVIASPKRTPISKLFY